MPSILIYSLSGRPMRLELEGDNAFDVARVGDVKLAVHAYNGTALEHQRLVTNCVAMTDDNKPLSYYGVRNGSRIDVGIVVTAETLQKGNDAQRDQGAHASQDPKESKWSGWFRWLTLTAVGVVCAVVTFLLLPLTPLALATTSIIVGVGAAYATDCVMHRSTGAEKLPA